MNNDHLTPSKRRPKKCAGKNGFTEAKFLRFLVREGVTSL